MIVNDVLTRVSQDLRSQLGTTGNDAVILIDYIDRINKDLLRQSRWSFALSGVKSFTTSVGVSDYWIGATGGGSPDTGLNITDLGSLKLGSVIDRTNNRKLFATEEKPIGATFTQNSYPRVYRNDFATPGVLSLYPPPQGAYTIEFRYYKAVVTLTATNNALFVLDKYIDVVTAGVNALGYAFLKKPNEVMYWEQKYLDGKRGMVRDRNLFPRGPEFFYPDPTTQRGPIVGLDPDNWFWK